MMEGMGGSVNKLLLPGAEGGEGDRASKMFRGSHVEEVGMYPSGHFTK